MSILSIVKGEGTKDIGFDRPYNGQNFNWPLENLSNPGPIELDPTQPGSSVFNSLFTLSGNNQEKFTYKGHQSSLKAYTICPPLSAIINRKAQCHINGNTWVMGPDGKVSESLNAKKLKKLFKKPNPIQSWKQFEAQQKIYMQIHGFVIVLPIIPAGYEKYGTIEASSLWNIPPYMVDITESKKLFYQTDLQGMLKTVVLNYHGERTELPLEKIGIFKDFTPSPNTLLFPESRVALQEKPINIIIAGLESEHEVISYAGSQGLITPDSGNGQYVPMALTAPQKLELQNDFKRQYGIRKGQFRYIISPAAIKWQAMGTDAKNLNLVEYIEQASKMLCDQYGYPPHLLGLLDPTFNNQNAAEKGLYQNTIMPEACSMYEEWNQFFRTDTMDLEIIKDYSHLPVLQEDAEMMARAMLTRNQALLIEFMNNMITVNEWREANGRDTLPNGNVTYSEWAAQGKSFGQLPSYSITNNQVTKDGNKEKA